MTHIISIYCDNCGHWDEYGGLHTNANAVKDNLVNNYGWQHVTYTRVRDDSEMPYTEDEWRCPACTLIPASYQHADEDDDEGGDENRMYEEYQQRAEGIRAGWRHQYGTD